MTRAFEIFAAAGWVAWPLLALSVVSVAVCLERAVAFWWVRRRLDGPAAVAGVLSGRGVEGLAGRFLAEVRSSAGDGPVGEAAVLAALESSRARLERYLPLLSTAITAAPMLGILGTVTGIIQSFGLLGEAETVRDTTAMAAGISEALYTTAFGLGLALVLVLPYNLFRGWASRSLSELETVGVAAMEAGPGG
ncbi:MAG: MotA/TolQ/ExbB proton channel family protein [Planctomycetota bacterium]